MSRPRKLKRPCTRCKSAEARPDRTTRERCRVYAREWFRRMRAKGQGRRV